MMARESLPTCQHNKFGIHPAATGGNSNGGITRQDQ